MSCKSTACDITDRLSAVRVLRDWLLEQPFTHFVTFNFNRDETLASATAKIRLWHAGVDRQLLGKRFNKTPAEKRTFFYAFFEHIDTNLHAHALLICPDDRFNPIAKAVWKRLVPSGDLHIGNDQADINHGVTLPVDLHQPITSPEGREYAVRYALKEQWKAENYQHFILSSAFLNK